MTFIKRIFLFVVINILVVTTMSFILNLFHIGPYLNAYGLNYTSLAIFCLLWGMCGAFISLALSRKMAKWITKVRLIDESVRDDDLQHIYETVRRLTANAGLPMPEVGVYDSREVNAFATGPTKKRSLIAVSSGLVQRMNQPEIEAVLAHEVSHIANGDMVTMTLLQGIVNAFVMFLARVLAYFISGMGKQRSERGSFFGYIMLVYLFEFIFLIFGSLIMAAYSRFREFRADQGGAHLAGKENMIGALKTLRVMSEIRDPHAEKSAFQSMKISSLKNRGFLSLFATHPKIEDRIERLQRM